MDITVDILRQPDTVNFSGNALPYSFLIGPYSQLQNDTTSSIKLLVSILVMPDSAGNFITARQQTFLPDANGTINFEIQSLIEPYLQYYLPDTTLGQTVQAKGHTARVQVRYQLINGTDTGSALTTDNIYVIKGGLNLQEWQKDALSNWGAKFFTNSTLQRATADGITFAYWMLPAGFSSDDIQCLYIVTYEDGSTETVTITITATKYANSIYCTPTGFGIFKDSLTTQGKDVVSWSVQIKSSAGTVYADGLTCEMDHEPLYEPKVLAWRNSLGGLDVMRMRGDTDFNADYTRTTAQLPGDPSSNTENGSAGRTENIDVNEVTNFTVQSGWLSQTDADNLRDLLLEKEMYRLDDGKWVPMLVTSDKNTAFYSTGDQQKINIELQVSDRTSNRYYSRKGLTGAATGCPAVEGLFAEQISKTVLRIAYSLPMPYSRVLVTLALTNAGTTYQYIYRKNSDVVLQGFDPGDDTDTLTITAQVLCNESPQVTGVPFVKTITVYPRSFPVAKSMDYYGNFYRQDNDGNPIPYTVVDLTTLVSSPDNLPLTITTVADGTATDGGLGTYHIYASGSKMLCDYKQDKDAQGTDSISYEVKNTTGGETSTGKLTFHISGLADTGVYVNLDYANARGDASTFIADILLSFFSDASRQTPLDVTGRGLQINVESQIIGGDQDGQTQTYTFNASGSTVIVLYGQIIQYYGDQDPHDVPFQTTFWLLPGDGYSI